MTGQFIIAKLKNLEPIEGADFIQKATIFGETIIIPTSHKEGEMGVLFDCETQLSKEYTHHNNLYRKNEMNKDKSKTGYIEEKRRIKPIKLRGVKCTGMWMPLESLNNIPDLSDFNVYSLKEGEQYNEVQGISISQKYIPVHTRKSMNKNKGGKIRENLTPTFYEHIDTDQLMRNTHKLVEGNIVVVTEKLHGTSLRVGYLPVIQKQNFFQKFLNRIQGKSQPKTAYDFVVGSRRVVKSLGGKPLTNKNHYYKDDLWTNVGVENFHNKLYKNETVYAEIVGFLPRDFGNIMQSVSNKKLKNFLEKDEYKLFIKRYGETTTFTYNCEPNHPTKPTYGLYIYRITMTNEDGVVFDLSWDQVKRRSEELGLKHCPELYRTILTKEDIENETFIKKVDDLVHKPSPTFNEHLREGVVVRIENGGNVPVLLKHKSFEFKVLEGIIKETDNVDIEESN